ncbi:MAG: hypothetical protein WCG25_04410 [bacterium]
MSKEREISNIHNITIISSTSNQLIMLSHLLNHKKNPISKQMAVNINDHLKYFIFKKL